MQVETIVSVHTQPLLTDEIMESIKASDDFSHHVVDTKAADLAWLNMGCDDFFILGHILIMIGHYQGAWVWSSEVAKIHTGERPYNVVPMTLFDPLKFDALATELARHFWLPAFQPLTISASGGLVAVVIPEDYISSKLADQELLASLGVHALS